ncbi:MAG: SDR family oxidoreductase [Helicobacteraceae bacterium]|nr:SDR family oxidoreductase [Helicobacteraceae bacterium]
MKNYILLSGGSSGIGKEIAATINKINNIIFIGRNRNSLDSNKFCHCDLRDIASISQALNNLETKNIETFIHCAGVSMIGYAKSFSYKEMIECANVNLYSSMEIIKFLLKNCKTSLKNIIFISSVFSHKAQRGNSFYASTKGGLESYAKSLALELAPKVRVNTIACGGIFNTNMTKNIFNDEQKQEILKSYPLGEGETKDVANLVEFLCKEDSRWITGATITLDGGFSL